MQDPGTDRNFDFSLALELALSVHRCQLDKGGEPYILHPIRVAMKMPNPMLRAVAVLHDALEDVEQMRRESLEAHIRAYFGSAVSGFVHQLTRRRENTYEEYIASLIGNPVARLVKLADLEDNLDESRWQRTGFKPPGKQRMRYEWARFYLKSESILREPHAADLCKTTTHETVESKDDSGVEK